jgi:hypothetical protein
MTSTFRPGLLMASVATASAWGARVPHSPPASRSNDTTNPWPKTYPDATVNGKVENALQLLACAVKLSLCKAEKRIGNDWVELRDSVIAAGNWLPTAAVHVR